MCLTHASAIDDPKAVSSYPADLLRQWKADQVEYYRQKMSGWPLTTAMAEQALHASSGGDISIYNSVVKLSGEGGRAPALAVEGAAQWDTVRKQGQEGSVVTTIVSGLKKG